MYKDNSRFLPGNNGDEKTLGATFLKILKEKYCSSKIPYSEKTPFKKEGKINTFPDT